MSNPNEIINHIAILLDKSGSMAGLRDQVIAQFNKQVTEISSLASRTGQKTLLSLYTFATQPEQPLLVEVPMDLVDLRPLTRDSYNPNGMTAMYDMIQLAIEQLAQFKRGSNDSFLVIVITDGQDTSSSRYGAMTIQDAIRIKTGLDTWSFVFLVPKGQGFSIQTNLGVSLGNIHEWDQTSAGVENYTKMSSQGLGQFYNSRASGQTQTKSFFQTDLSNVTTSQVAKVAVKATGFKKGIVTARTVTGKNAKGDPTSLINDFCVGEWGQYKLGHAYYELTKREKIQDHKSIVIEDRSNGGLFTGPGVRTMLGLPEIGQVSVNPGDHGKFRIFVQSTSVNRKLLAGTEVLYQTSK